MTVSAFLLLALPACLPLALTLLNLLTWPRGQAGFDANHGKVSVLIPARNEEAHIEACLRSILVSGSPLHEVIVYNDSSTDRTEQIVQAIAKEDSRVRCLDGLELPDGWVGKPHACHQLSKVATGDILVFVDADTTLLPGGLNRLLSLLEHRGKRVDIITGVPRQVMGSFAERLIMPLLVVTYTSWFPLRFVWSTQDPRFLAANGQLMAIRRKELEALGGFASIAHEIVDDMALCRRAKQQGRRVLFADGFHMASCRMYRGAGEIWRGFSKNFYEGIGESPIALAFVIALLATTSILPFFAFAIAAITPEVTWWKAALFGVAANVALRVVLVIRHRHPPAGIVFHPLAVLGLIAIGLNSFAWSRRGTLRWAGRVYAARRDRSE
jgi:chlorobactene glucosyltransferase